MRIGIDSRMISMTGIGTYLRNLIDGIGELDRKNEFVLFMHPTDIKDFKPPGINFRIVPSKSPPYSVSEQILFPKKVSNLELDLIHYPHYFQPFFGITPVVVTIHDMIHQIFPHFCPSYLHWKISWLMIKRVAKKSRIILTVSKNSAQDIKERLHIGNEKVRVIYNSLPKNWGRNSNKEIPVKLKSFLAERSYFLYVGNHKLHKNIPLLLQAFSNLKKMDKQICLVLTGENQRFEKLISRLSIESSVYFLGNIDLEVLQGIYSNAYALVLPSLYEGFGLPALEAMSLGIPPIVSDAGSLPEVVGDAGMIFPVSDIQVLENQMLRILEDAKFREELSKKCLERAASFSILESASQTLSAYEDAIEKF
ncbi:MAG: hypothetical protein CMH79_02450 [Nitrospinae bacterium]|nr:hypothetical protein [Nitrospinota bacterium]